MSSFNFKNTLFAVALAAQTVLSGPLFPRQTNDSQVETIVGVDLQLPATAFGASIEGAAVNSKGDIFAADYRGGGQVASSAYGFISQVDGGTANILDDAVNPYFVASPEGVSKPPLLAGARFRKGDELLLTG